MIERTDRWESSERYYELYAGEDLFGEAILVKVWGGKGSGRGGSRTLAGAPAMLERERLAIAVLRRRHGYVEVECTKPTGSVGASRDMRLTNSTPKRLTCELDGAPA